MKRLILGSERLKQASVRIEGFKQDEDSKGEEGSGFLINGNKILTARHVVVRYTDVPTDFSQKITANVTFNSVNNKEWTSEAILIADDFDNDIALLELLNPPNYDVRPLPLTIETPQYNARFSMYGYPRLKNEGGPFYGDIIQTNVQDKHDIELKCLDLKDYSGLSGSPLVVDKQVCGIILHQKMPYLHAVSIGKIKTFLQENNIEFDDGVEGFEEKEYVSNEDIFENLETAIITNKNGYFLLSGSPGTGKTTTVKRFEPVSKNIEIRGRYLVNDGTTTPAARSSRENLLDWLELVCLEGRKPDKNDLTTEKRIEQLPSYLEDLAYSHREKDEIAVIFIDGLDDVTNLSASSLDLFLSILPYKLPNNLAVVFSCTSKEILPNNLAALIDEYREVRVLPLDIGECTNYILNQLPDLEPYEAQMLAARSEGHPLYLRYLIRYIQTQEDVTNLNSWVNNIPIIHGEIKTYYEEVWARIKDEPDKIRTALTVSQLREPVSEETLREMLPENARYSFETHFPKLSYLFKNERLISIYHASFREFISEKAKSSIKNTHDCIADYCTQNPKTDYSIAHRIYHFTHSQKPERAISACTQTWADTCALHDVEPDLVLYDIQQVQGVCIDLGKTIELIRVKLLLARISFRYNMVFKENAAELAEALIAIGRPKAALKYILRGDELLVTDFEIPYFIQKITHLGHIKEAEILYNAARRHINKKIENDLSMGHLRLEIFDFIFDCILFLSEIDFQRASDEYWHYKSVLTNLETYIPNFTSEHEKAIDNFKYRVSARQSAYFLWHFGFYMTIDDLKKSTQELGLEMDERATQLIGQTLVFYHHFENHIEGLSQKSENMTKLQRDLEFLIDEYGYFEKNRTLMTKALFEESKRYDIVEKLIKESAKPTIFLGIREPNGVDVNHKGINDYFNNQTYKGYIDTSAKLPYPSNRRDWENFLVSVIDSLGFITGKGFRLKAENRLSDIDPSVSAVKNIVKNLEFSLRERAHWERSYALPEAVLPYIYSKITDFYIQFSPDEILDFIKGIEQRIDEQMGLFTEGVRESLFAIAEKLSLYEIHKRQAFKVLTLLEKHIEIAVQNRWERTRDFIRLLKLYGKLGNKSKSTSVYQKMLDTSMGPSWYKEDQLTLVNIALTPQKVQNSPITYFQDFAGILEAASGEMTFQRYARTQKEAFIGSLAKAIHVEKAIEYLKFQLLPESTQIIQNAESSNVDALEKGRGYILGAKEIVEPNAVFHLIDALPQANPLIRWAFCEIFVINEDVYRYVHLFGRIQAQILNQLAASNLPHLEMLCGRLTNLVFHEETLNAEQAVDDYLKMLRKTLQPYPLSIVKEKFKNLHRYTWDTTLHKTKQDEDRSTKKSALDTLPDFYLKAKDEFEMSNNEGANTIIKAAFDSLKAENWDIWIRDFNVASQEIFKLLKQSCETDLEVMTLLKPSIIEHSTEDWRIVYQLIELLNDKLTQSQTDELLTVVKEHFHLMVRPEQTTIQKYNWLNDENTEGCVDEQLLELLIWFLNHPVVNYKSRAMKTLIWLGYIEPNKVIPKLFEECLAEKSLISTELSAYVLQKISLRSAEVIWQFIKENAVLQAKIVASSHFMIKHYLRQMFVSILDKSREPELLNLCSKLRDTIPDVVISTGEVFLEEAYLKPIQPFINEFNHMEILNGMFCKNLKERIKTFSKPLSEKEQLKADVYLKRSFYDTHPLGNYDAILRYSLNVAITPRIDKQNLSMAAHILELDFLKLENE